MSDTTGGTQFYSALQAKAMAAVKDIIHSELYPIQYPSQGDFMWNYQNANQVFNDGTYQYVNACVSPGEVEGTAALSAGGGFANAYVAVLNALVYSLSSTDQKRLNQAQANASVQSQTIVTDYQSGYGTITQDQLDKAGVKNKPDYVIGYVLGAEWSGVTPPLTYTQMAAARNLKALLPKAPMGADQVITDVTTYLNLMQPVNGLSDQLQNGAWTLSQLKANTEYPTAGNGGLQTFNPNSGEVSSVYNAGWAVPSSVASITNDLQNTGRTIEIGMQTSQSSGDSVSVSVEGQTGFSVGTWLTFDVGASASYDMSKAKGTSTDASVSITYAGYSVVPMAPAAWQQATNQGFFYADPIRQAVSNGTNDVTGFKFLNSPPYNLQPFADGGDFGLLTNLLISNYPTIKITYQHADFATFSQNWSEKVSGNLSLFGFISLGSFSEGAYGSSYEQGSSNESFSVTFSASPEVTGVPQNQKTAYVIGGAVANPGSAA